MDCLRVGYSRRFVEHSYSVDKDRFFSKFLFFTLVIFSLSFGGIGNY